MPALNDRRIRVIVGHYGSGKTEFSVNYAFQLAKQDCKTALVDLDIANPYFRSRDYMNVDMCESAHGRAPAIATGIRRVQPDKIIFTYQGDGDLASIGTGEIVHAAHRGEKFTTFFINNAIYGMTGGQMAPTSLIGQKTTTSIEGRKKEVSGMPIRMAELLATIDGAVFVERVALDSPTNVRKAKKVIEKAIEVQQKGLGFGFVEILSSCPTNWGYTPVKALEWLRENMIPYYPLGNLRCPGEVQ